MATPNRFAFVFLAALTAALAARVADGEGAGSPADPWEEPAPSLFPELAVFGPPNLASGQPVVLGAGTAAAASASGATLDHLKVANATLLNRFGDGWGELSSKVEVNDTATVPDPHAPAGSWKTEDVMRLNVTGPVFVFGQLGASCDAVATQGMKVTGKTGLACKLQGWQRCEVQVQSGPTVTYDDPLRPERTKQQSEWLLELQCRYPLLKQVHLEYQGTAIPALSVAEHDRVKQDLHLAIPLGELGKFSVGAKHNLETAPASRPWTEQTEFYIGVDLKR